MKKNALRPFLIRNRKVYPLWISKFIAITIVLLLGILFVAKFAGPSILRLYVESGIGTCQKIPILCVAPEEKIHTNINKEYIQELLLYKFPKIEIYLPTGFTVIQQQITKVYYKRDKYPHKAAVIYLFYKDPNFFINLFPQVAKQGTFNDYEFIRRTMHAKLNNIKDLHDVFFVIMKSIFTPDLGNQRNVKMVEFKIDNKRGFINYNLTKPNYYFDCNVIDAKEVFFKIYIKDIGRRLDLAKVLTIISTVNGPK